MFRKERGGKRLTAVSKPRDDAARFTRQLHRDVAIREPKRGVVPPHHDEAPRVVDREGVGLYGPLHAGLHPLVHGVRAVCACVDRGEHPNGVRHGPEGRKRLIVLRVA